MHKGQSSIDLMIAIMVALVFFAVLNTHSENLDLQAREISVKNDLRAVLLDVYSAVGSAKAYGLTIDYASPKLRVGQNSKPLDCMIKFSNNGGNNDSISVESDGKMEAYQKITLDKIRIGGGSISIGDTKTLPCGQKFTLGWEP